MRPRASPFWPWVLALAALAAGARSAAAEPTPARAAFAVQIAADRNEAAALQIVLRDAASGQAVDLATAVVARIEPSTVIRGPGADRAHPPLGRAFVDMSDPVRATVYVVDGTWQRILVRQVPRGPNPDVARETVARIVSTAIEALLAGSFAKYSEPVGAFESGAARGSSDSGDPAGSHEVGGTSRGGAPADAPGNASATGPNAQSSSKEMGGTSGDPRAGKSVDAGAEARVKTTERATDEMPPSGSKTSPRVGAMYEAAIHSSAHALVHGPAIYAAMALGRHAVRPALFLTVQYRWPITVDAPPIGVRLSSVAVRLLGGAEVEVSPRFTIEIGAGVGLDVVRLEPRRAGTDEAVWLAPERSFVAGVARVMAGARFRLGATTSAHLLAVADIDATGTRLLFDGGQGSESVLALYSVRPGLAATLSVP